MAVSCSAFAGDNSINEKLEMNDALKSRVDTVAHGKIKGLAEVIDQDVKFTTTRRIENIHYNKTQILISLKKNKNVEQNCVTEYSLIESNATLTVVKLVMKYESFSKVTYLSMENSTKGWKITNLPSSFN
jgi:hypothetical protein